MAKRSSQRDGGTRAKDTGRSATSALPDLSQYGRLAEYNRKRHFGVRPEPPGSLAIRDPGRPLQFVV